MRRPLRVLHILWSLGVGGIEVRMSDILSRLDPADVTFDFLVFERTADGLEAAVRAHGASIFCVSPYRYRSLFGPAVAAVIRRHGPYDVAHCHLVARRYPLLWSAAAGVKVRLLHLCETSFGWPQSPLLEGIGLRLIERGREGQAATHVLAVSRATAESWYPSANGSNPCEIFHGGVSLEPFHRPVDRAAVRRSVGLGLDAWVIGHVGRLVPVKNHPLLLGAFARIVDRRPDARLLLIGDGPDTDALRAQARRLGVFDRVVFAGMRRDVPELLMGAVDHFVFPSLAEGLPGAVLEAQAAGLPITLSSVITPEVEAVPGLFRRADLSASAEDWATAILRQAGEPRPSRREALDRMEAGPFSLAKGTARLLEIYRREAGVS